MSADEQQESNARSCVSSCVEAGETGAALPRCVYACTKVVDAHDMQDEAELTNLARTAACIGAACILTVYGMTGRKAGDHSHTYHPPVTNGNPPIHRPYFL